ncbi:MAG: hypothetical protein HYZ10_05000 [Ignavibacteriales bacterium]|nr:hypothetical protein [Ignavibacteriales bacterium]
MGKLKLNLDEIKVESFETNKTDYLKGTVIAQEEPPTGLGYTCEQGDTCWFPSCQMFTCFVACNTSLCYPDTITCP